MVGLVQEECGASIHPLLRACKVREPALSETDCADIACVGPSKCSLGKQGIDSPGRQEVRFRRNRLKLSGWEQARGLPVRGFQTRPDGRPPGR